MALNFEQLILQKKIKEFINGEKNGFFGILGSGGTGKTHTVCLSIETSKVIFLGATNKVVSVLKKNLTQNGYVGVVCKTIDSFFKFKITKDHNNISIISHRFPKLKDIPEIIVIDEISLINDRSFELIMKLKSKRKIILIGDNMQIPPIEDEFVRDERGFKVSKIFFELDEKFELKIQNRQNIESKMYEFISKFRENMSLPIPLERIVNKYKNDSDMLFFDINDKALRNILYGENPIAVCYKNLTCLSFNWLIGSTKSNNKGYRVNELNVGDYVFFDSYYKKGDSVFYTSDTVKIIDINHIVEGEIKVTEEEVARFNFKEVLVRQENGIDVIICVGNGYKETLYPIKYRVDKVINKLKKKIEQTNNNKHVWVLRKEIAKLNTTYSDIKLGFATLKKPFAITTHKSQGSTYDDVIIPVYDFANRHHQDVNQLVYVAISRAKKRLIFVNRKSHFKDNSNRYPFTEIERNSIASIQNYKCKICSIDFDDSREFDIDHEIPIANGGKNSVDNLQAICKICHKEKTAKEKYNEATI